MKPTVLKQMVEKIIHNDYFDPFEILGPHQITIDGKSRWVVRAFIPNAKFVFLIHPETKAEFPMYRAYNDSFFEVVLEADAIFFYRFRIEFNDGTIREIHDPYIFLPPITEYDMYLFANGEHHKIYEKLGAHLQEREGVKGVQFAVWAPNARNVSVIGDFNQWHGGAHQMRVLGQSGIWELFIPGLGEGTAYKYEIKNKQGHIFEKSDPYGFSAEVRPRTASVVADLNRYTWQDEAWLTRRKQSDPLSQPVSVYEVHLGSWRRKVEENSRFLTYRELADALIDYVKSLGFTHIELLPVSEHPLDASWGYQTVGYFAATSRFGTPADLMYLIDKCHQNQIGVIIDWVPAHFPKDGHGLSFFDGTHLYEHQDPRLGEHLDWGTKIFNFGRNEVRNFLMSNALFWFDKYHIDGIRVDAVASMLYLDYSRPADQWVPNRFGGRENLEAIDFMKKLNEVIFSYFPGALSVAEESTAWPGVTKPTYLNGLGFNLKWNMGWMNDFLTYFSKNPVHRKYHHNMITFALLYAFHENFMLVLSHDEVVHGKRSLLDKMPGDMWQKFANLRALFGFMFGHPGKKLLFMGSEFGQWREWNFAESLDWHLLQYEPHRKLQAFLSDLNHLLVSEPALYEKDFDHAGFQWIDFMDSDNSVICFMRKGKNPRKDTLVFVCNFTPVYREAYRIGVDQKVFYKEVLNSDAEIYWGSNQGNLGGRWAEEIPWHGLPYSVSLNLPPLSTIIFKPVQE